MSEHNDTAIDTVLRCQWQGLISSCHWRLDATVSSVVVKHRVEGVEEDVGVVALEDESWAQSDWRRAACSHVDPYTGAVKRHLSTLIVMHFVTIYHEIV